MNNNVINARFVQKRDTSEKWEQNKSFILLDGELGVETDTGKIKIGDGLTPWSDLIYATVTLKELNEMINNFVSKTELESNYANKTELNSMYVKKNDISSVYTYKGSIDASYLLNITNQKIGDVYNCIMGGNICYKTSFSIKINGSSPSENQYNVSFIYNNIGINLPKGMIISLIVDENKSSQLTEYYSITDIGLISPVNTEIMPLNIGDEYFVGEINCNINDGANVAWTGYMWDELGGSVDTSSFVTKTEIPTMIEGKQDKANITIGINEDCNVLLEDNQEYRIFEFPINSEGVPTLILNLPSSNIGLDYISRVLISASDVTPTVIYGDISWSGVDCNVDGFFTPISGINYILQVQNFGTIENPVIIGNVGRW